VAAWELSSLCASPILRFPRYRVFKVATMGGDSRVIAVEAHAKQRLAGLDDQVALRERRAQLGVLHLSQRLVNHR
jgi:hypothetical protein